MDTEEVGVEVLLDLVSLLVQLLFRLLFCGLNLDDLGEQLVLMEIKVCRLRFGSEVSLDQVLGVLD